MNAKVALHTLGCKLNFSETSTVGKQFLSNGFDIVDYKEKADVYVLNTCTVTENADKECRQYVRKALKENPEAFIIVMGCYAQLRPDEIASIKGVDLILGSNEKFKIFSLVDSFNKKNLACIYTSSHDELNEFGPASSSDADDRTRAFLKIQDGCDYKCSFCTIPLARGKSRSMDSNGAVESFNHLLEQGYKEIILTGVNVGDYGKFIDTDLYSLLLKFNKIEGDFRIRISSIEPNLLTDDILNLTANNNKFCNHFHIPLQSGSEKILRLMQRRYKLEDYRNLIYKVQSKIPDAGIGVDVITGFPGETKEDFLDTYNFIKELPVSYLHAFTYSERPNTKAINMNGKLDTHEKRERTNMLRILSEKKKFEFHQSMFDKTNEVLFETENHDGFMNGFTSNYIKVRSTYNEKLVNSFNNVKIKKSYGTYCEAEIITTDKSVDLLAS